MLKFLQRACFRFSIYLSVISRDFLTDKCIENLKSGSRSSILVHVMPSNFFRRILRSEALLYKSYFFITAVLRKLFDIRFSYNHCNFFRVCLLVKMASKTVTRSTEKHPFELNVMPR